MGYWSDAQVNLAANTKTANLIAGDQLEFITIPSVVRIYGVNSEDDVRLTVFADNDVVVDDQEIVNVGATINRSDHLIEQFNVDAGTRLFITLREDGGAATADTLLAIETDPL